MFNNVDTRIHLLQGMMDINGSIDQFPDSSIIITYTAGSQTLLEQILQLLYSMGFSGKINKISGKESKSYYGEIKFCVPNNSKTYIFSIISKRLAITSMIDNYKRSNDLKIVDNKEESFVRGFLGRMLFSGEEALKQVLLFRILQVKDQLPGAEIISCNLIESGFKQYFTDNFESIILEMAIEDFKSSNDNFNIFRPIDDIANSQTEDPAPEDRLFAKFISDEKISS